MLAAILVLPCNLCHSFHPMNTRRKVVHYQWAKMRRRFAHDQVCMPELLKFQLEPLARHKFESNISCHREQWEQCRGPSRLLRLLSANLSIVAQPEDVRLVPFQSHLACTVVY